MTRRGRCLAKSIKPCYKLTSIWWRVLRDPFAGTSRIVCWTFKRTARGRSTSLSKDSSSRYIRDSIILIIQNISFQCWLDSSHNLKRQVARRYRRWKARLELWREIQNVLSQLQQSWKLFKENSRASKAEKLIVKMELVLLMRNVHEINQFD